MVTEAACLGTDQGVKEQVYKDERPAEHFQRFHERVRRGRPDWAYEFVRLILTPYLGFFFRTRAIDSDKVPTEGAVIVAPNHFSFLDHFFVAVYLRRKVQFLAKSQLFRPPLQFIYSHGGVFPILRGRRDDEAFKTAHAVLGRGGIVVMYAEGGSSRAEELGEPKPGLGRLALESGVPVVPAAICGSANARNWNRSNSPRSPSSTATRCASSRSRSPRASSRRRPPSSSSRRSESCTAGFRGTGGAGRCARRGMLTAPAEGRRPPADGLEGPHASRLRTLPAPGPNRQAGDADENGG